MIAKNDFDDFNKFVQKKPDGTYELSLERLADLEKRTKQIDYAEQYVLLVTADGWFPCFNEASKKVYLYVGEVWKYGVSKHGVKRHNSRWYQQMKVEYWTQFRGSYGICVRQELEKNYYYPLLPENLKRANKLPFPPGLKEEVTTEDLPEIEQAQESYLLMAEIGNLDTRPIGCTAFIWYELPHRKIQLENFNAFVNDVIRLSNYGNGLKNLTGGFITYPFEMADAIEEKNHAAYYMDKKLMELYVILDYEYLLTVSETAVFEYLKQQFLASCKRIFPTFEIENFDTKRFLEDLAIVLEKEA
jgi:hypothetical protein